MSITVRPRRSVLYMPGSNARALEKARTLAADSLILDLEDAVAPDAKATAREQIAASVAAGGFGPREVVIRVNGTDTPWFADDLAMAAKAKPDAVLIPKVSDVETLVSVGRQLDALGAPREVRVWAMVETPLGVLRATDIALAAKDPVTRLSMFVLGTNDLAKETGTRIVPGRLPMLAWLSTAILAARAGGIEIVDGVWNAFQDVEGFTAECAQAAELGFDGKTLIHPAQIGPCNAAFTPPDGEIELARQVIAVFDQPENAGKGVIQIEGRMFERMHADIARKTVALAEAIAARAA
ncbi:CoA ester lyase [Bosea sp. 117]|uniref:HpcH/HpaI aldolase/citrate lyase family protein n=1 Tax=Bosea sp. 117 TaxID=1125973 RepID=UPI000493DC6B|nr:CoA ester lyase [Bosea sp. 117]